MEYIFIIYYLVYGASTAFFMNKLAPVNKLLLVLTVTAWPLMLPLSALLCGLTDGIADQINKEVSKYDQ